VTGQRSANNRKSDFLVNQGLVARIAEVGRLRVDVVHATALIHAAGTGITLTLAAIPPEERDPRFSDTMRDAILTAVTVASAQAPKAGQVVVLFDSGLPAP
jgi:hypothetical protein